MTEKRRRKGCEDTGRKDKGQERRRSREEKKENEEEDEEVEAPQPEVGNQGQ